jgi:hypothetical protein
MKVRLQPLYVRKPATYDRVIVDGRILPLNSAASVVAGATLSVTLDSTYPVSGSAEVVWLKQGEQVPASRIIDHFAKELAIRRPA